MTPAISADREQVLAVLTELLEDVHTRQKDTVNGLMAPELHSIQLEEASVTFRYTVHPWEANRFGQLHGGIMTTMMDHACGLTATAYTGHRAPTLSLTTDYIRPANVGDQLLVTAAVVSKGRRIIRMRGEIIQEESGKLVATCTGSFFIKEE